MRAPGLFSQYIQAAGQRIAADPLVPPESRAALARQAEQALWQQWHEIFGGERVRVRAPDEPPRAREARDERIAGALLKGHTYAQVARQEQINKATVLRIVRRLVAK